MAVYLLAHDLGTSGNKASLFDENDALIKSMTAAYPLDVRKFQLVRTECRRLVERGLREHKIPP